MKSKYLTGLCCALLANISLSVCVTTASAADLQVQQQGSSLTNVKRAAQQGITVQQKKQAGVVDDSRSSHQSMASEEDKQNKKTTTATNKQKVVGQPAGKATAPVETVAGKSTEPKSQAASTLEAAVAAQKAAGIQAEKTTVKQAPVDIKTAVTEEPKPESMRVLEKAAMPAMVHSKKVVIKQDDTTGKLWRLFSAGKFKQINKIIAAKKQQDNKWTAPKGLVEQMYLVQADRELMVSRKNGDYPAVLKRYRKTPAAFGCERLGWAMFLAEAQVRAGARSDALATYQRLLRTCNGHQRIHTLEHAMGVLPINQWQPLVKGELHKSGYNDSEQDELNHLWYNILLQNVQIASDKRQSKKIIAIADQLQPMVMKYDDPAAAEIIGWSYFQAEEFNKALTNFSYSFEITKNPDALRGKAFCLARLNRYSDLRKLVKTYRLTLTEDGVIQDLLPILAGNSLVEEKFQDTLDMLDQLEKIRPLNMGEMSMKGWAHYHFEHFEVAAETFEELYRLKRDDTVARGLYHSLKRQKKVTKMAQLADELGGPFRAMVELQRVDDLYKHRQYLAVHDINPVFSDKLTNIDAPYVRASYMAKLSKGEPIYSNMTLRKEILEGRTVLDGANELNIRLEHLSLNAGAGAIVEPFLGIPADPGQTVGTMITFPGQLNYATPVINTRHSGYEWSIGYNHESDGTLYLEAGQVLIKSAIKNEFKFKAGYERRFDDNGFQVEGYRQPLRETLISYVGVLDPYQAKQSWGQVSRNGGKIAAYQTLPYNLNISGNFIAEKRTGTNVKSNNYMAAYGGLSYNIGIGKDWFDYLALGPYLRWEHSKMDQNWRTIGHGGYFSPQWLLDWGLGTSFLTKTGKRWLVSGSASFGKQSFRQTPSPLFPIPSLGNPIAAALTPFSLRASPTSMEYHYQYRVALVFALADRWRINGEYKQSRSWSIVKPAIAINRAYMDRAFTIGITYHFDDRGRKLLRRDIPSYRLEPLY